MESVHDPSSATTETAALIERARGIDFFQGELEELAKQLPTDDEALASLLEGQIAALQGKIFSHLWMAAHWANRRIPARLLVCGAELLTDGAWILATALRCTEPETEDETDMGIFEALLRAVERRHLDNISQMICLVAAAQCWRESRSEDEPLPSRLALLSRRAARDLRSRQKETIAVAQTMLSILAYQTGDEALMQLLRDRYLGYSESASKASMEQIYERFSSLKDFVPENRPERVLSGYQVRRAVPKVGRNQPCPCGSGKRYKKCCLRADQQKLLRSSEVAGKTLDDLEREREERLTFESLGEMRLHQVMRLDPSKIAVDMAKLVIQRLVSFGEFDHALTIYEKSSFPDWEGWEDAFEWFFFNCLEAERYDLALKVVEIFPGLEKTGAEDLKFVRARGDHGAILDLIEENCREILEFENQEDKDIDPEFLRKGGWSERDSVGVHWIQLAHSLRRCGLPHFELAFTRGILPLVPRNDVDFLLERIEVLRDSLGFPLVDVSEELADLGDRLDQKNLISDLEERLSTVFSSQLENTSEELKHRNRELAELKRSLRESSARAEEAETAAREKEIALESLKAESPGAADRIAENEAEITELRRRLRAMKSDVKRKHEQRNELRRELRDARREAVETHASSPPDDDEARADAAEDALLEPASSADEAAAGGFFKPRIPIFPSDFLEKVKLFPPHVQSSALQLAGRLASGDSTAFTGVRKLKLTRDLLRQRFSGHYRMLFRIHGDQIEIVDVIDRRDLQRWLQKR